MPSIKDFDLKKKKAQKKKSSSNVENRKKEVPEQSVSPHSEYDVDSETASDSNNTDAKVQQRRPSKMPDRQDETSNNGTATNTFEPGPESYQSFSEPEPFELHFPGSFLLKAKAPKTFDLAERIAGEWVNDGTFEALPVGHPLAQILAAKALVKAKSLEKNVLNSTSVTLVKMGLVYAKAKIKR